MDRSIAGLVRSPARFFASEPDEGTLLKPTLVVVLAGGSYGLSGLVALPAQVDGLEGAASAYFYAGAAFSWVVTVLMTLLLWVLYAGAFFTVATFGFGATGDFRRLFRLTGWGFIGQLVAGVTAVASQLYVLQAGESGTGGVAAGGPLGIPVFTIASVVGMVAFLWSAYLWNYAVQYTFALDVFRSLVTVGIPVLVSIGLFYVMTVLPGLV